MTIEINNIVTISNLFYFSLGIILVTLFLWHSKKFVCYIIIGILIFLWLPYIIDFLIIGRIKTNITSTDTWLGFMGSYLGSGLGAGITLIGVFYQLDYTKKMEEKNKLSGFISYINYSLKNISLNKITFEKAEENKFFEENKGTFYEISETFLQENIKLLFSIEKVKAEKVLNFFQMVFNYNKRCQQFSTNKNINVLMNELIEISKNIENKVEIKRELINAIFKAATILTMLDMIFTYKWILDSSEDSSKEEIKKNFNELIKEIIKKIKEIQNLKYIKTRKNLSFFKIININNKNIESFIAICYKLKELVLKEEQTEEEIFILINLFQGALINELITKEEYNLIDNSTFINLEEKKDQLLNRIELEKKIIEDKKIILSLAPDLIKDLEEYI